MLTVVPPGVDRGAPRHRSRQLIQASGLSVLLTLRVRNTLMTYFSFEVLSPEIGPSITTSASTSLTFCLPAIVILPLNVPFNSTPDLSDRHEMAVMSRSTLSPSPPSSSFIFALILPV